MKIYTKTGDIGETSLIGGKRVNKNHHRIEAYGTVDELNSFLGLLCSGGQIDEEERNFLKGIQHNLFIIGAILAAEPNTKFKVPELEELEVHKLEMGIDKYSEMLPDLKNFILPAGHYSASLAHVCRTICRRAERKVVNLKQHHEEINPIVIKYLNRLSDWLFMLARKINYTTKTREVVWDRNSAKDS